MEDFHGCAVGTGWLECCGAQEWEGQGNPGRHPPVLVDADNQIHWAEINLGLEKLRVFWRMVHKKHWISPEQLIFVIGEFDQTGQMVGAWLKSVFKF